MDIDNLSVGTRINHEKYGEGIISQNNALTYKIIFVRGGELEFSKEAVAFRFSIRIQNVATSWAGA